ncbi:MAG: transposase zinc-binding domain-containing protein [Saprospiraceae bacterium]|nr:transposase zinc-binding domain-containing protein [Saprospiraceae bacterium]
MLFSRDHGEEYIRIYKPSIQQIKLIRAIRVCKTPALGGHVFICKDCGHKHFVYHSCGHSHCMICQSIKRERPCPAG